MPAQGGQVPRDRIGPNLVRCTSLRRGQRREQAAATEQQAGVDDELPDATAQQIGLPLQA